MHCTWLPQQISLRYVYWSILVWLVCSVWLTHSLKLSPKPKYAFPKSTSLSLLPDPATTQQYLDQGQFLDQLSQQTAYTFTQSFEARIIGTIVGNILAGVAFKVIADAISRLFQPANNTPRQDQDNDRDLFQQQSSLSKSPSLPSSLPSIPTPQIPPEAWLKLLLCILIDAISDSSFLLPGFGELEDVVWAPLSAFAMKYLFDSDAVAIAEFIKEILPFTDIIPLASTIWLLENVFITSPLAKILKLKNSKRE